MMMEHPQQQPPPYPYSHDPDTIFLPPVPTSDPPSARNKNLVHLPNRDSLQLPPRPSGDPTTWQGQTTLNHASFPQVPTGSIGSPMSTDSVALGDDQLSGTRPPSVVSMDDPDVRLAAEAMCGLSKSPQTRGVAVPPIKTKNIGEKREREREPLLRLLTTSHPWLGTTIHGSLTAYALTKNYSPRVVRDSAEYIERNIGTPVANTVSSVGRRTGVESGIRRYLGEHRRPSDLEAQGEGSGKRRRIDKSDATELERGRQSPLSSRIRNDSASSYAESLPPYDDNRSPNYEETTIAQPTATSPTQEQRMNWSTQLIMTTSGLGAALHKESLEKLKYCMSLLRHFTEKLGESMEALQRLLQDYEASRRAEQENAGEATGDGAIRLPTDKQERSRHLADQMKELGSNIWKMLHHVMQSVIKYTWGALPDNASRVVRGQVMSAPDRWRRIQHSSPGNHEGSTPYEATATHHMLTFAKESLEMMAQVSAVIGGTIESAEAWLGRMGRTPQEGPGPIDITDEKRKEASQQPQPQVPQQIQQNTQQTRNNPSRNATHDKLAIAE